MHHRIRGAVSKSRNKNAAQAKQSTQGRTQGRTRRILSHGAAWHNTAPHGIMRCYTAAHTAPSTQRIAPHSAAWHNTAPHSVTQLRTRPNMVSHGAHTPISTHSLYCVRSLPNKHGKQSPHQLYLMLGGRFSAGHRGICEDFGGQNTAGGLIYRTTFTQLSSKPGRSRSQAVWSGTLVVGLRKATV